MQWRIRNKRSLGNGVSWVYEHGAGLEDQEDKYWLCQRCYEKGDYKLHQCLLSYGLVDQSSRSKWTERWTHGTQGAHKRPLAGTIRSNPHAGLQKAESAILTQLRTGKIGFNRFLYDRGVPSTLSPRCTCGLAAMTVRHVLLA